LAHQIHLDGHARFIWYCSDISSHKKEEKASSFRIDPELQPDKSGEPVNPFAWKESFLYERGMIIALKIGIRLVLSGERRRIS